MGCGKIRTECTANCQGLTLDFEWKNRLSSGLKFSRFSRLGRSARPVRLAGGLECSSQESSLCFLAFR